MDYWLAKSILAARNGSEDGWVQILFFVILAIFYAVSSIVKTRANKTSPKTPGRPARKPPDLQILKQFFGLPEEPESSIQPSPEASKTLKHPAVARKMVRSQSAKPQAAGLQVPSKLGKVIVEAAVPLASAERNVAGVEIPQSKYLSEILSDYENPESLRRAILHYEILGKPLSLRDSSEHIY